MASFPTKRLPNTDISSFQNDASEQEWKGPFTFICAADTQYGMIDQYWLKRPLTDQYWDKEIKLSRESIQRINRMNPKPKFYIICGDMLDAFPYDEEGEENCQRRALQYNDFVEVFKELDPSVKLVCVCGNHDIGNIPTEESLETYSKQFGPDLFSFWVGGVKFVVLNSQYFMSPEALPTQTKRQIEFISESIADPKAKHVVVFQHIPFFLENPDEPTDKYFNLEKELRLTVLDKLINAGVRYVFCGHFHRNAGGFYKNLELVVTSALGCPLGNDPSGFRVVNVSEERISHEYVPFRKTPAVEEM